MSSKNVIDFKQKQVSANPISATQTQDDIAARDNVIAFPDRLGVAGPQVAETYLFDWGLGNPHVRLSLTGIFMVFMLMAGRQWWIGSQYSGEFSIASREPSSVAANSSGSSVSHEEMEQLVRARWGERELASLGAKPDLVDDLKFGTLRGRYQVRLIKGQLVEISWPDDQDRAVLPVSIPNRVEFIWKYQSLLPQNLASIRRVGVDQRAGQRFWEEYALLGPDQKPLGQIHFQLNEAGQLYRAELRP